MKMKNLKIGLILFIGFALITGFLSCKKDKKDDTTPTADKAYMLMITTGARSIQPGESLTYSARLIDKNGVATEATGVTWSSSSQTVATINASGIVASVATGTVTITASVTKDGVTYTASVPLGISTPSAFSVAPSAIIYEKGGSLQLESIYLSPTGVNTPSCTYSSSNSAIASVSSTGLVSFIAAGECAITVTATNIDGQPACIVPVLVIGVPDVELPVTRVVVNPPADDIFKNETLQLTAKAYKGNGEEVSGKTFTWTSQDPSIATVSSSGLVSPHKAGTVYIQAVTDGIIGQAEIFVNPDTLVWITPFNYSIPAGSSKQFTATAYHLTRTSATPYSGITFEWSVPTFGIDIFDIATVNSTGLVTLKSNAMAGMMTFVEAHVQGKPEIGSVATIGVAIADDCNCGSGNSSVHHITVSNSQPITMSLMSGMPVQLNATAYTSSNAIVSNPALVYCSNNIMVVSVDSSGQLIAAGQGTATIKICSGPYAETTVTVNVNL